MYKVPPSRFIMHVCVGFSKLHGSYMDGIKGFYVVAIMIKIHRQRKEASGIGLMVDGFLGRKGLVGLFLWSV